MSKKFKINDRVRVVSTGETGTIKGREITPVEGTNRVKVEYVVKVGDGFDNWKAFSRKEIEPTQKADTKTPHTYVKLYDVVDGYKITLYAVTERHKAFKFLFDELNRSSLRIGYAIYNPVDVYDENVGIKLARKRSRVSPLCTMYSDSYGEFNKDMVYSIMDTKADYIKNNLDKFIKGSQLTENDLFQSEEEDFAKGGTIADWDYWLPQKGYYGGNESPCEHCSNNPKNNPHASGICHCILGNPVVY